MHKSQDLGHILDTKTEIYFSAVLNEHETTDKWTDG